MTCCHAAQCSSRFSPRVNHHCGAAAKTASPAAAATRSPRRGCRRPRTARTSSAGSAHTQWWDQETGDISSAAKAFRDSAQASSAPAMARRMPAQAAASTAADAASHTAVPAGACGSSPARPITASMDWLAA
jgi:hypothetical protein